MDTLLVNYNLNVKLKVNFTTFYRELGTHTHLLPKIQTKSI